MNAEIAAHYLFRSFCRTLFGPDVRSADQGYDPSVDPRITLEFACAAFRFGHSIVSAETERIDNFGAAIGPGLELKDTLLHDARSIRFRRRRTMVSYGILAPMGRRPWTRQIAMT